MPESRPTRSSDPNARRPRAREAGRAANDMHRNRANRSNRSRPRREHARPFKPLTPEQLAERAAAIPVISFPDLPVSERRDEIARAIRDHQVVIVSGETGSGKTTLLNALSQYIPKEERLITIEDNAELQILDVPNLVRLEARNANVEGIGEITIRELIRSALRMRPNRIIVGEVRGPETIDMLQAIICTI